MLSSTHWIRDGHMSSWVEYVLCLDLPYACLFGLVLDVGRNEERGQQLQDYPSNIFGPLTKFSVLILLSYCSRAPVRLLYIFIDAGP
jgi:hypothetical protein